MDANTASQLGRRILLSGDPCEVALLLREGARRATGVARAGVFGWSARDSGVEDMGSVSMAELRPDPEIAEAAFTDSEPITLPHPAGGIVTILSMRMSGRRLGLLVLDVSDHPEIDSESMATVVVLVEHAATALSNLRAIADSQEHADLLGNVLDSISNGIVTLDSEHRAQLVNHNAMAMLSIGPVRPRTPLSAVMPEPLREAVEALVAETDHQGYSMERRVSLRHAGGPQIPLAVSVSPLREATGSSAGYIVVLRDMTASQELERLRRIDEMKSRFVANVSHELKTPLTSIKAYTEALMDMVGDGQPREFLKVIDEESDRLLFLINDLLNISRIQSGQLKMHFELTDPGALVPEALRILRVRPETHQVLVEVQEGLPKAMLDRDKIKEVLINLLSNAVKYSPKGGKVWLRLRREEANLRIEVQDQGLGISKENQARLFEAFFRVDDSLTYEVSGTGLGLAIVKAIVEQHGGRAWVESELGAGSTFSVLIPIRTQAPREEEPSLAG